MGICRTIFQGNYFEKKKFNLAPAQESKYMMFLPGPSFLIHLIILSIIKLTKKEEFLFEKKQSANYFAFVIIFIVSSIVFLSAFILIKASFKYSTTLTFVSHALTTGEALAAGEKPVQIKKEVHRREAPVEAAPMDFGMDTIDVFAPFEIKINDFLSFQPLINLFTELNKL